MLNLWCAFVQKHQDHNLLGQQNPFGNLSMDVNEDNIKCKDLLSFYLIYMLLGRWDYNFFFQFQAQCNNVGKMQCIVEQLVAMN
jgi:hypothetical protein